MSGVPGDPLSRARAAAMAELRRAPAATPWRREAARVAGAWVGVCLAAGAAAVAAALADRAQVLAQAPFLAALLALAGLGGVAALAPRSRALTWAVLAGAPATMAALAWARGAGLPSTTPEWVCSVSHVGLDVLPLLVGLWALGRAAWTWPRALVTGLAAGTAGAFLGELGCHQGMRHVLVHHVGAWLLITAACVAISRLRTPRTFAP
jgi:hypothetical protein